MRILGLDIGGANIKASDADGATRSIVFPMWTQHAELSETLQQTFRDNPAPDLIALTTTAELADCFATKEDGVRHVISAVTNAFPDIPVRIWMTSGEFAEPDDAAELSTLVAAANWHALATWCGRAIADGPGFLLDIGSTTTDIIPLLDGHPVSAGLNDSERLQSGELVYTGAFRTPLCAVTSSVTLNGKPHPLAAELFATIADALVISGAIPEDESCTDTADGRSLTLQHSRQRMARMLCHDATEFSESELTAITDEILAVQQSQLTNAFDQVCRHLESVMQLEMRSLSCEPASVIVSGSGRCVASQLLNNLSDRNMANVSFLADMFRTNISDTACAFAVARLAQERCADDLIPETQSPVVGWPDKGVGDPSEETPS